MFNKVYLVGVGLINASLAKDLKRYQLAKTIIGVGRDSQRLAKAQALDIIDNYQLLQDCNVSDADVIILGVPVGKTGDSLALLKPSLNPRSLLTDVGSTKGNVVQAAEEVFGELPARFVPGHPIAGSEQSGFEYAQEDLFQNRKVILTPTENTDEAAVQDIKKMWLATGAQVEEMTVGQHDAILSATSHLPHMVAYTLVNYLGERDDASSIFNFAAGGFYDFTRIASSDPTMWVDICKANKDRLLESIDGFSNCLNELRSAIDKQDGDVINALLKQAKHLRDASLLK
ncbi:MAG: prephenate dehydrogenase/arogenate dehydrogenase family protein [Gammaproteobacteria bacterium]|nr:prephenate dehydrogenase/arogenate dehydrogenase family protein [Gammaproteobacteria bacterium]